MVEETLPTSAIWQANKNERLEAFRPCEQTPGLMGAYLFLKMPRGHCDDER